MADIATGTFTGRLTKDAENKTLPTGTQLVEFDIAVNKGWGDSKKTLYWTCKLWGKQGQSVFPYLKKGKAVAVTGSIDEDRWTSQHDMTDKKKNVLVCTDCTLQGGSTNIETAPEQHNF